MGASFVAHLLSRPHFPPVPALYPTHHPFLIPPQKNAAQADSDEEPDYPAALAAAESEALGALGVSRRAYKGGHKGSRGGKQGGRWQLSARGRSSSSSNNTTRTGSSAHQSSASTDDLAALGRGAKFPERLFELVSAECGGGIVRWAANGKAFLILDEERMVQELLPKYEFKATKLTSLQRNLNMYGFVRLAAKGDQTGGAYAHPGFQRGMSLAQVRAVEVRRYPNGSPSQSMLPSSGAGKESGGSGARSRGDESAGSGSDDEIEDDEDDDDEDGSSEDEELEDEESEDEEEEDDDDDSAVKYPMLPCPVCNKPCRGSSGLANHVRWHAVKGSSLHHKNATKAKSERGGSGGGSGAEFKIDITKKFRRLPCPVCKRKCKGTSGLANHVKWHSSKERAAARRAARPSNNNSNNNSKLSATAASTNSASGSKNSPGNPGTQTSFACFVCGQKLATFATLALHVREHTGERFGKPIRMCGVCGKTCAGGAALANHVKMCTRRRQGIQQRILAAQKAPTKVKKSAKVVEISEEEEEDDEESEDDGGGGYEAGEVDVDDEDEEDGEGDKDESGKERIINIAEKIANARINLRANRGGNRRHLLRCKLCRKGFASTQGFSSHMQMHQRGEAPASAPSATRSGSPHSSDVGSSSSSSSSGAGGSSLRPPGQEEPRDRSGKQNNASFPLKLHQMITEACPEFPKAVAWLPNNEPGFQVLDQEVFMGQIMPRWGFKATQFSSFHRNLQVYGFNPVTIEDNKPGEEPKSGDVTPSDVLSDQSINQKTQVIGANDVSGAEDNEDGDKNGEKESKSAGAVAHVTGGVNDFCSGPDNENDTKVDGKSGSVNTADKTDDKTSNHPSSDENGDEGEEKDGGANNKGTESSISSGNDNNGDMKEGEGVGGSSAGEEKSSSADADEGTDKHNDKSGDMSDDDDDNDESAEEVPVAAYSHPLFLQHLDPAGLAALAAGCRLGTSAGSGAAAGAALGSVAGTATLPRLALGGEAPRQRKPSAKAVDLHFSMRAKYRRKDPLGGAGTDADSAGANSEGATSPAYPPFTGRIICRIGGARVWPFLEVDLQASSRSGSSLSDNNSSSGGSSSRAPSHHTPSPVGVEARSPDSGSAPSLEGTTADRPSSAPPMESSDGGRSGSRGPSPRNAASVSLAGLTTRESLHSVARRNLLMQQMEWRQEDGSAVPDSTPVPPKGEACSGGGGFLHKIYSILHRQPVYYGSKGKSVLLTHAQYCTVRWDFERDSSGTILSDRYDSVSIDSTIASLLGSGILFEAAEFKSILRQFTQAGFEVRRMNDATTPSSVGKFACDPGDEDHFSVRYSFQGLSSTLPVGEFVRLAEASMERKKAKPPRRPTIPLNQAVPLPPSSFSSSSSSFSFPASPSSSLGPATTDESRKRPFESVDEARGAHEEPSQSDPSESGSGSGNCSGSVSSGIVSSSIKSSSISSGCNGNDSTDISSNSSSNERSTSGSSISTSNNIGSSIIISTNRIGNSSMSGISSSTSSGGDDKRMRLSSSEKPSLECALCNKVCAGGAALANHMKMCAQKTKPEALSSMKKHTLIGPGKSVQGEAGSTAKKHVLPGHSSSQHHARPAEATAAEAPAQSFTEANHTLSSQSAALLPTPGVTGSTAAWTVPRFAVPALQSYRPTAPPVGSVGPTRVPTAAVEPPAWGPRPLAVPQVPSVGPTGPRTMLPPPSHAPYVPHLQQHPPALPQVMRVPPTVQHDEARKFHLPLSTGTGASNEPMQSFSLARETDRGMRPPGL